MREAYISENIDREDAELGQAMRGAEPPYTEPEPQYTEPEPQYTEPSRRTSTAVWTSAVWSRNRIMGRAEGQVCTHDAREAAAGLRLGNERPACTRAMT